MGKAGGLQCAPFLLLLCRRKVHQNNAQEGQQNAFFDQSVLHSPPPFFHMFRRQIAIKRAKYDGSRNT